MTNPPSPDDQIMQEFYTPSDIVNNDGWETARALAREVSRLRSVVEYMIKTDNGKRKFLDYIIPADEH